MSARAAIDHEFDVASGKQLSDQLARHDSPRIHISGSMVGDQGRFGRRLAGWLHGRPRSQRSAALVAGVCGDRLRTTSRERPSHLSARFGFVAVAQVLGRTVAVTAELLPFTACAALAAISGAAIVLPSPGCESSR